jgi:FixJ family two-component response regulator
VAISAKLIKADLTERLPQPRDERRPAGDSFACCPPRAGFASAAQPPAEADLDQAQLSIVDDDDDAAQALAAMLRAEGFPVRVWASAGEFITEPPPVGGGCLIASVPLPEMTGVELQCELAARQSPLPVIFLTPAGDIAAAVRGMKAGAINCLPKPVQRAELLQAVREALTESRALCAQRSAQLRVRQLLECLTPREREVLDLAVAGLLVKQIAARLGTAEKTVKTHKGRLMRKMQVRSTLGLVKLIVAAGFSPVLEEYQPGA